MISLLKRRLAQAMRLGPRTAMRLALSRARRSARFRIDAMEALLWPSGMHFWRRESPPAMIFPLVRLNGTISLEPFGRGTFDLLASGPRMIERPFDLRDLPKAWCVRAKEMEALAVADLAPIDWQLDPTSGHRWGARTRSSRIAYGEDLGVEVKWPWEIGRLQHLPAIAARMGSAHPAWQAQAAALIRGHIVDFVRSNPPGFGVQWLCPMDVGIRIANLLVAVRQSSSAATLSISSAPILPASASSGCARWTSASGLQTCSLRLTLRAPQELRSKRTFCASCLRLRAIMGVTFLGILSGVSA